MSTIKVNKILSADNPEINVADGLTVTGEVKVGSAVTSNSTGIDVTGVVTATSLDASGVASCLDLNLAGDIIHTGDTNTRIKFAANDTVTIETDGEERARIDSDGRLLYGQTTAYSVNPGGSNAIIGVFTKDQANRSDLIVSNQSNANNAGAGIVLASHGQDYIIESTGSGNSTDGAGALSISRSTEERLRITSTGDVEIKKNDDAKTVLKGDSVGIGTTTTAGRNAGVGTAAGTLIFNSTANELQVYSGNRWDTCSNIFSATGGNTTYTQGNYKVHVFTSNGDFVANASGSVDALVVAGGGGGGATSRPSYNGAWAGGGGAGGVLYTPGHPVNAATYPVVIGAGGGVGSNGNNSTALGLTAIGGGRGGGTPFAPNKPENQGAAGGSGGGGLGDHPGPSLQAGAGTAGQGNSGGAGIDPGGGPDNYEQGGGGGGAGEAGNTDGNGFGGDGRDMSAEFGTTYGESGVFGGGGAGGAGTSGASYNEGGLGGGGDSGNGHTSDRASTAGATNTGGGGGAGGANPGSGGQPGGPGIVLIRYLVN